MHLLLVLAFAASVYVLYLWLRTRALDSIDLYHRNDQ